MNRCVALGVPLGDDPIRLVVKKAAKNKEIDTGSACCADRTHSFQEELGGILIKDKKTF